MPINRYKTIVMLPYEMKTSVDAEAERTNLTPASLAAEIIKQYFNNENIPRIPVKHDLRRALDELNNQT